MLIIQLSLKDAVTKSLMKNSYYVLEIKNLKEQIGLYEQWHTNDSLWISLQKEKIQLAKNIEQIKSLFKWNKNATQD